MKVTSQKLGDWFITFIVIVSGSWAGAKIFGHDTWECYNDVMDYYAVPLEIRECMYGSDGMLRRIVLALVLTCPLMILALQGLMMTVFGTNSRAVRAVAVFGGLAGSIVNCLQLGGLFFEDKSFPCQVESPSPTSRIHKDRRSFECYINGEEGITKLLFLELVLMMSMVGWSIYTVVKMERNNREGETGGGETLGSSSVGRWWRRSKKNSQDLESGGGRVKTKAGHAAEDRSQHGSEEGQDRVPLQFLADLFNQHAKDGIVAYDKFGRLMKALVEPLREQGLNVPDAKDNQAIFKKYDTRGDGKLAVDEWKSLASEEVYKNLI